MHMDYAVWQSTRLVDRGSIGCLQLGNVEAIILSIAFCDQPVRVS